MIVAGEITRDQALQELERDIYGQASVKDDLEFVIKKLGLTEASFQQILDTPPKKHTDYPSNIFWLERTKSLKQSLKRIATRI
jgi:hypothetical protein